MRSCRLESPFARSRKPYQSRLKWRDQDGEEQSKLLLTKAETVIAVVLRGEAAPPHHPQQSPGEAPAPQRRAQGGRTRHPTRLGTLRDSPEPTRKEGSETRKHFELHRGAGAVRA